MTHKAHVVTISKFLMNNHTNFFIKSLQDSSKLKLGGKDLAMLKEGSSLVLFARKPINISQTAVSIEKCLVISSSLGHFP